MAAESKKESVRPASAMVYNKSEASEFATSCNEHLRHELGFLYAE